MSTTATTPSSAGVAPWKPLFLSQLSKMDSPEFVLSSLSPTSSSSSSSSPPTTAYVPRARYCIFRGMWCELPVNKHNTTARNPHVYESDMLTFTTDARMQKVPEIFASSAGHGDASQSVGSGGGGPVEAVFWIKEAGAQWRFRGHAYIIGPDIESHAGTKDEGEQGEQESSGVRTVKSRVGSGMRRVVNNNNNISSSSISSGSEEQSKADWSWWREVCAHFGNLNPLMKGSFKNPPPGTPVGDAEGQKNGQAMGQKVEGDLDGDEVARRNFRVVVIKAEVVEQLDTTMADRSRRYRFTYVGRKEGEDDGEKEKNGEGGEWKVEELWP